MSSTIESKDLGKLFFETSLELMLLLDSDGDIVCANDLVKESFGENKNQWSSLFQSATARDSAHKALQVALDSGQRTVFVSEMQYFSGRRVIVEWALKSYAEGIVTIGRDVTQRAKLEEQLRNVVEHSINWFYSHTTEHKLTYLSPQVEEILGYTPEEAEVRWTELTTDNPINKKGFEITQRAIDTGKQQPPYFLELRHKKGHAVWVEVREKPIVKEGKTVAIAGSLTDVTERRIAEEALRKSERNLNEIVDFLPVAVGVADAEGNMLKINRKFIELFGYSPQEIPTVEKWFDLAYEGEEYRQQVLTLWNRDAAEAMRTSAETPARELTITCRDGSKRIVEGVMKPGAEKFVVTFVDMTDQRRARRELRESEERFHLLADAAIEGIFILRRGCCLEANSAAAKMFGYGSPTELIGSSLSSFISAASLGMANASAVPENFEPREAIGFRRDGSQFPVTIQFKKMPYKDIGDVSVAAVRDMSELKEQQRRFQIIAEASADIIYEWDVTTDQLTWLGDIDSELGYEKGEIEHTIAGWINVIHPEDLPLLQNAVEHHRTSTEPIEFTYRVRHKDGQWCYWYDRGYPIVGADGLPKKWIGACSDVTAQKDTEDQLRQSQKMEAVGRLAGGVAHDLNNLLTPILGYCQLLELDLDPQSDFLSTVLEIKSAGNRARDLVCQLLAFSRKQSLQKRNVSLSQAILNVQKLLQRTLSENIDLKIELTDKNPNVHADAGQLEQVLLNLSINGADAMPNGGTLEIRSGVEDVAKDEKIRNVSLLPGTYATLTVRDTGHGMDNHTRDHIFEPFFTTKGDLGTGLGLAMVYGIVKQHSGSIFVESKVSKGSRFKIYLPLVEEEECSPERSKDSKVAPGKGRATILLVEDNEQVRLFTERVLHRFGYEVIAAADGPSALEKLTQHQGQIDLLFTDVFMPGMNGKELFDKIVGVSPETKVLYMSGYSDNVIATRGVLDSKTHLIQKPYELDELMKEIEELLEKE